MIVNSYSGFAFGTPSQHRAGVDCPPSGSWEGWCDCVFSSGSDLHTRCHTKPWGLGTAAPWTEIGAGQRGLPKPGSILAMLVGGIAPPNISLPTPGGTAGQVTPEYLAAQDAARRADAEAERRLQAARGGGKGIPTWAIGLGVAGLAGAGLIFMKKGRKGRR